MKKLYMDCSTNYMYLAVYDDDRKLNEYIRIGNQDHAQYFVDAIEKLLDVATISLDDIEEIILGVGPGSYTGIRVCVMTAKMFGYTKKISVSTVSSLIFLSSGYKGIVSPMIDARRGFVFACTYDKNQMMVVEDLYEKETFIENNRGKIVLLNPDTIKIDCKIIDLNKKQVDDIHNLQPNYIRKTEAERNYDQKHFSDRLL